MEHLKIDELRRSMFYSERTGIYIRAMGERGWESADIAWLDKESLYAFLRSRGGDNAWAEDVCAILLGHEVG